MKAQGIIKPSAGKYFLITFTCLFLPSVIFCQNTPSIKSSLNRDQVLLGEQVQLSVEIKTVANKPVTKWYNLPDSFHHLEILNRSSIDSANEAGMLVYRQTFTITGFDSGRWVIPSLPVSFGKKTFKSDSLYLFILPVKLTDSTYHDIREIIDVEDKSTSWWIWIAAGLSLVVLGVLVYLWLKSNQKLPGQVVKESGLSPLQEALQSLQHLKSERLSEKGDIKTYYSRLSDIFKKYVQRKLNTPAMQSTTSELLVLLSGKINKEQIGQVAESLRIADAVKFAKYQPDQSVHNNTFDTIEGTIKLLDNLKI